jgi:hypothetical protein
LRSVSDTGTGTNRQNSYQIPVPVGADAADGPQETLYLFLLTNKSIRVILFFRRNIKKIRQGHKKFSQFHNLAKIYYEVNT